MNRGDVVLVDFTRVAGPTAKRRPAVVIQNDNDNRRMTNTIVAVITGNVSRAGEPTQLLIDPATGDGTSSGLHRVSVVNCSNLFTVKQRDVVRTLGRLAPALLGQIDECLKAALGVH